MITFRLCFLTPNDHLADIIDLPAPTLEAAIALAEGSSDGRRMELWCADERLKAWPAVELDQSAAET